MSDKKKEMRDWQKKLQAWQIQRLKDVRAKVKGFDPEKFEMEHRMVKMEFMMEDLRT